jgi:hypothetical protein
MKRTVTILAMLLGTVSYAQDMRRHDATITQVNVPQGGYQVMTPEQGERIATQAQALADMQLQLTDIKKAISDIQKDIEVLKQTNWVFGFVVRMIEIFVPALLVGMICTWFGVRLAKRRPPRPPRRPVKATAV